MIDNAVHVKRHIDVVQTREQRGTYSDSYPQRQLGHGQDASLIGMLSVCPVVRLAGVGWDLHDLVAGGKGPSESLDRLERDLSVVAETLALFIRFWLTVTPPLPQSAQVAAQAKGLERFESFLESLGRRLARGRSVLPEVSFDRLNGTLPPGGGANASITAKKSNDGSVAVQFGGCDGKIANCLPTTRGWYYWCVSIVRGPKFWTAHGLSPRHSPFIESIGRTAAKVRESSDSDLPRCPLLRRCQGKRTLSDTLATECRKAAETMPKPS